MTDSRMWMVRAGEGGTYVDEFREKGLVAIGWSDIGDIGELPDKDAVLRALAEACPEWPYGRRRNTAAQLIRFRDGLGKGDRVITYDASRRLYHVGRITGTCAYQPDQLAPFQNVRSVAWEGELERDRLSLPTRNRLGSTLTLFRVPDEAASEIEALFQGTAVAVASEDSEHDEEATETEAELLQRYREEAFEIVKDRATRLDADAMERLVAGLLRAMGYRIRQSSPGPDRGVDVIASPDGFGFEPPRIVVEVKHRPSTAMGADALRSFLGGRHAEDKGLYVSTGGFTREARYEAERAKIPLTLMDLGELIDALMNHYDNADWETQALLPMMRLYWPI